MKLTTKNFMTFVEEIHYEGNILPLTDAPEKFLELPIYKQIAKVFSISYRDFNISKSGKLKDCSYIFDNTYGYVFTGNSWIENLLSFAPFASFSSAEKKGLSFNLFQDAVDYIDQNYDLLVKKLSIIN